MKLFNKKDLTEINYEKAYDDLLIKYHELENKYQLAIEFCTDSIHEINYLNNKIKN